MGLLDGLASLFGGNQPTMLDTPVPKAYPGQSDVDLARRSDAAYADPAAAFVQGQGQPAMGTIPDFGDVADLANDGKLRPTATGRADTPLFDQLMRAFLASRHSAVAGLGFDPHHMSVTRPDMPLPSQPQPDDPPLPPSRPPELGPGANADATGPGPEPSGRGLTAYGLYQPQTDQVWYDGRSDSTPVHESFHRGIQKMRDAGVLPPLFSGEESVVRGLMQHFFGDVEKEHAPPAQYNAGAVFDQNRGDVIQQIEAAAAKLYAQQHPRGPR